MANIKIPATGQSDIYIHGTNVSGNGTVYIGQKVVTLQTGGTFVPNDIDVTVKADVQLKQGWLANSLASGETLSDFQEDTSGNTVVPVGGNLYIHEGWYPATRISLGQLIPDISTNDAANGHILSGYKAYDENGNLLEGTIATVSPTFSGGSLTVTGTVTDYSAPSVTINATGKFLPSGTGNVGATYGVTTTAPTSGTEGTNYLSIDATGTPNNGSCKAQGSATRAKFNWNQNTVGYLSKTSGTEAIAAQTSPTTGKGDAYTITPGVTDSFTKLYIPIVSCSFSGGGVTATAGGSVTTAPVVTYSESCSGKNSEGTTLTASNYGIEATTADSTNGYFTFVASGASTDGTVQATANASRTAVTYTNSAGAIAAHSGTQAVAAGNATQATSNITVTPTATAGTTTKYRVKVVAPTASKPSITVSTTTPSITCSATDVVISHTGGFYSEDAADNYGVHNGDVPSGMRDGVDCLALRTSGSGGTLSYSGTVALGVSRAAIKGSGTFRGVCDVTTSTTFRSAENYTLTSGSVSGSTNATITGGANYYIPIVSCAFDGGAVTATAGGSVTTAPKVTYSASCAGKDGNGNSVTIGNYGIATTTSSSTNGYITFTSSGIGTNGTVQATADASRTAVTYTNAAGAIAAHSGTTASAAASARQSTSNITVTPTAQAGTTTKYRIPIVSCTFSGGGVTATAGGSVTTAPVVTYSEGVAGKSGSTNITNFSTYGISDATADTSVANNTIVFSASGSASNGTVQATADASRTAVTYTNSAGAIVAHSGSTASAAASATQATSNITVTPTATAGTITKYKIPIVTCSFSGGAVTATAGGSVTTTPSVTYSASATGKNSSGNSVTIGDYGLAATTESSTNGYLTIVASGSASNGTVQATADASRTAVTYTNSAGAITAHSGTTASAAASATQATSNITVTPDATAGSTTKYRIPIVSCTFSGGGVTATAGGSVTTAPSVTYSASAAGKDSGGTSVTLSNYGVATTTEASSNGYITFTASGSASNGTVQATANASRTAVTYTNSAGAIVAHSASQALAAANATQNTKNITVTPTATAGTTTKYRIPIVTCSFSGGSVTATAGGSVTTAPVVTYTESVVGKNGNGTTLTAANYGITTADADSTNGYFTFTANGSSTTTGVVNATASASSTAVTVTNSAGAIAANSAATAVAAGSGSDNTNINVTATATRGTTSRYKVPVRSVSSTVDHTLTAPSVTISQSYVHNVQGTIQQTNPDGILGGTPSDLSTYTAGYLFFSPSHTETNGSTTATGHGTISAGITAGGTANSTTSTKNIVPTVNEAQSYYQYYIKVYDGSYNLT